MYHNIFVNEFATKFFTQPLLGLAELIAIIIGLKYVWKDKIGKLFIIYLATDFVINIADWYMLANKSFTRKEVSSFTKDTNTLIALLELNVYYLFFKKVINQKRLIDTLYRVVLFFSICWVLISILNLQFINKNNFYGSYIFNTIEIAFMLPPSVLYILQILKVNSELSLFQRPSFWISTGIFFFSTISIPCYLLLSYLLSNGRPFIPIIEATLYYTPLIINVMFITKAFLCKKHLTT